MKKLKKMATGERKAKDPVVAKVTCISGLHAVASLLAHRPERILRLQVSDRQDLRMQDLLGAAAKLGISVEKVSKETLDAAASGKPQGVVAFCHPAALLTESDLPVLIAETKEPPFLLVLDGVQDPHNLGACLRNADAAGVTAVIIPKDRSSGLTEAVARAAAGAAETVPLVQVTNLARTLAMLKEHNIWIYGASGDTEKTLYQEKLTGPVAIVLGAEGTGLRRLTSEHCDVLLKIPMQGTVESLNVSVAAGVFLFEVVRQRG